MSEKTADIPQGRQTAPRIVVAGAGSIGSFTGGLLAASGLPVSLLARPRIIADIQTNGLTLSDYSGFSKRVTSDQLALSENPDILASADLVLVCVKTGGTAEMADLIARYVSPSTPIISLQNGLTGCEVLRAALLGRDVRAAMVPFNVVPAGPGHYHRATSGDIIIQAGQGNLAKVLTVPGLTVLDTPDIAAIQWGKMLINLNNALNALSGMTLRDMLMARNWRRLMADQMAEALRVLASAGIAAKSTTPLSAWMIPHVLRLPTWAFSRIAAQMLTIDPTARTSMAYDLIANRVTEIDSLQGVIIDLGKAHGIATPICTRVAQAIHDAETSEPNAHGALGLTPGDLRP